jgi:hypothetical protein
LREGIMRSRYTTPSLQSFGTFSDLTQKSDGFKGKSTPGFDLALGFGADGDPAGCTGEAQPHSHAGCALAIS